MKRFVVLFIIAWPFYGDCQKQGNQWFFGNQTALNFNSGFPVILTTGKTGTDIGPGENQEGTASLADSAGALLFYTGGRTIWNKYHLVMLNGSAINGGPSSTQAALILPLPGSDSLFYVFTSDEFQSYSSPNIPKGYRYSVVNMCLDNGKGGVINNQKNILLVDSATEKLAACRDQAGTGYWVLGHKMFSDSFYAWHLTATGITSTVVSSIGTLHGWYPQISMWGSGSAQGQMKFDPSGNKLALVLGNLQPANLELFDFNRASGLVSNNCRILIDSASQKWPYGVEFSPDGSKLYYAQSGGMIPYVRLYQLNLSTWGNCFAIKSASTVIFQSNAPAMMLGMQLAPDNKIYIVYKGYAGNLARINAPNLSGALCGFDSAAISSPAIDADYAFPTFISGYTYSNKLVNCNQTNHVGLNGYSPEKKLTVYPVPSNGEITVALGTETGKRYQIIVFDPYGQVIFQADNITTSEIKIQSENLKTGIYFLVKSCDGKIISRARIAIDK